MGVSHYLSAPHGILYCDENTNLVPLDKRNWQVKFGPQSWREDEEIVLSENKIDKNKGHKKIKIIGIVGALAVSGIAVACVKRMKSENQIVSAQDTTIAMD